MKTKLMALAVLAGGTMFAQTRLSVGVQFGGGYSQGYYEPAPVYAAQPPCPGPDYYWVDGYWGQNYGRRNWVAGYWNRRPVVIERGYQSRYNNYRGYDNRAYDNRAYDYRGHDNRGYDNRGYENRNDGRGHDRGSDRHQDNGRGNSFRR